MSGLEAPGERAPGLEGAHEPPPSAAEREHEWVADHTPETRDTAPAVGTPGQPASWRRDHVGAEVGLARPAWGDSRWSFLFKRDTSYAEGPADEAGVRAAGRRARSGDDPGIVQGPVMKPPVWTWEVPLYFWFGGIASGSAFVALACDVAGDHRSAAVARKVALGAVLPSPPLLIMDLGRPARFLNMLRIFKPRSPMSMGAWALVAFSNLAAGAVVADLLGRPRTARALGGANAVVGGYLGSYTGVLLATTAVPVWARSRVFLGPIFVSTATATGAAASRLALVASGLPTGHPTRQALGDVETGAMLAELVLSTVNERRLGRLKHALEEGRPGLLFRAAKGGVLAGLSLRLLRRRLGVPAHNVASVLYLLSGLGFRYAWVEAGRHSAQDDEAVARTARGRVTLEDAFVDREDGRRPTSMPGPHDGGAAGRAWSALVGRVSLAVEGVLPERFRRH